MKFSVHESVFDAMPNVCFGVVVARGVDNRQVNDAVSKLLDQNIHGIRERLGAAEIRDTSEISVYRNAFQSLGYNPNKFMCSIEALVKRIMKGGMFPRINTTVDLGNAISLKYIVPIGAHDIGNDAEDIEVRFAVPEDTFVPFGTTELEKVDAGELVYARGNSVKTRKWIWRQSSIGMITEESKDVFFPIDGFIGENEASVRTARKELAEYLEKELGCSVSIGWVDQSSPSMTIK